MKHFTILLLFLFFLNQNLSAQKPAISIGICIERAQKNSFLIHAGEKQTEVARNKYLFVRSQSLPQIQGELAADYYRLKPYSFNQTYVMLNADWSLGDLLLNTAQFVKQDSLIAKTTNQQQRLDVSLRSAMLYINILQQQEHQELLRKRLTLLDSHYDIAKALWQSGIRTRFDLLQTEAEIARLKEDIALRELDRQNFTQELAQLIDEKNTANISLQPLDTEYICNLPLPELPGEIIGHIPVIESMDLRIKAQQLYTRTVTAQQLPHVNFFGGFMQDGDPTGDGNNWQVGIGISLPLFRWNASSFQKQETIALRQALDFQKRETERDISIFFSQIRQKLTKLSDVIRLQKQRLKITGQAYKLAEANYQAGLVTNLEYLSAQEQLNATYIAIQETQLDYAGTLVHFYIITNQLEKINEL